MKQLIKDLIAYRERNELKKKEMTKLLGCGYSADRLWEDGIQTPNAENAKKIEELIY